MSISQHYQPNIRTTAAYRPPRPQVRPAVQQNPRKDAAATYPPFSSAVALVGELMRETILPEVLNDFREAEASNGADASFGVRDLFVARVMKILIGALSSGEICAYVDTPTGMREISSNFWSLGSLAWRKSAELRLLGEREVTIDQWAALMGSSCAGYDLAVAPYFNRRDLKRWARSRLQPAGERPETAHRRQVTKELIAICREGEGRLINAHVRRAIQAKIGAKITDHCWKLAKRAGQESEPKVRTRFAVGAPTKN